MTGFRASLDDGVKVFVSPRISLVAFVRLVITEFLQGFGIRNILCPSRCSLVADKIGENGLSVAQILLASESRRRGRARGHRRHLL